MYSLRHRVLGWLRIQASLLFLMAAIPLNNSTTVLPNLYGSVATASSNFYINPVSGSDKNSGLSTTLAFKTIQHALDLAHPGTVINLAPGSYHEILTTKTDGTSGARIVIHGTDTAKDPTLRHKTVLYGSGRIINVNNSYYQFDGFAVNGQQAIPLSSFPTDPAKTVSFKDAEQSLVKDGRLIYVGSAVTAKYITGIKITNMFLHGAGGECVRIRNASHDNEVSNSVIEWCGMLAKTTSSSGYRYHNGEGIYLGTSPDSTTQPMYKNDSTNNTLVTGNIVHTFGSECFDVKENAHNNSLLNNECSYNIEPLSDGGSNIELRGYNNTVANDSVNWSAGYNIKIKSDSSAYMNSGNNVYTNSLVQATGASIDIDSKNQLKICGNTMDHSTTGAYASLYKAAAVCP